MLEGGVRAGGGGESRATILKAWIFHAEIAVWLVALVMAVAGKLWWATVGAVIAFGLHMAGRQWSRSSPVPMPHFMRWVLLVPRGPQRPTRLRRILRPTSGERILEVGPGVGVHALPVAASILPDGVLEVIDIQQEMLEDLVRRAARQRLTNLVACRGDAQHLPYADATFDAAYLISVLGEIPDPRLALREIRRVLKPGGRLLVAEMIIDPDFISLTELQAMTSDADLALERYSGPCWAYGAVFRRSRGIDGAHCTELAGPAKPHSVRGRTTVDVWP